MDIKDIMTQVDLAQHRYLESEGLDDTVGIAAMASLCAIVCSGWHHIVNYITPSEQKSETSLLLERAAAWPAVGVGDWNARTKALINDLSAHIRRLEG
jgi:hypothetical protein